MLSGQQNTYRMDSPTGPHRIVVSDCLVILWQRDSERPQLYIKRTQRPGYQFEPQKDRNPEICLAWPTDARQKALLQNITKQKMTHLTFLTNSAYAKPTIGQNSQIKPLDICINI